MSRNPAIFSIIVLLSLIGGGAATNVAALSQHRRNVAVDSKAPSYSIPNPVSFRDVSGRGLLVRAWVNGIGPFNFAIDTGAGATILSPRVADEAQVARTKDRNTSIAGLSGATVSAQHASIETLAIGDRENYLPAKGEALISNGLPADLDGLLDPTEGFSPWGYTIDLPRHELAAFDPRVDPVQMNHSPVDGAVVSWMGEAHGRRPFVVLDNGDRALLDTGSNFGLAVRDANAPTRTAAHSVRDVGGGQISTRRSQTNISIGSLTLERIPTDFVTGAEADAPVLLGLTALRPFRLRFDPLHRLIEIAPTVSRR